MTRVKHNWNPKFTREQLLPILYQQTLQVSMLLQQLEDAYMQLEQANLKITQLVEVHKVGVYVDDTEEDASDEKEDASDEEEDKEEEEDDNKGRKTLVVMDSHVKSLKARKIEEVLGGRLYTGQYCWEMRAFNSGQWPNAKHPHQNQKSVVPKLLSKRPYTDLILNASCNDVSNLKDIEDGCLMLNMAKKSSLNTVQVAVSALAEFPSLRHVLIIPRTPRLDDELLGDVSMYGNDCLESAIADTGLENIKLGCLSSIPYKTEMEIKELFGAGPKRDLLHMRGVRGRDLFTQAMIKSIKDSGLCKT